ncbi:MAG: type II toxin-antitoxin system VapC family toxin [Burkholderiales bacterium]|nr:type II toxin-antitoxin system VapC family toxin [Burkholderiales bacterium]
MMFVLDASIALSWMFEDEATPARLAILESLRNGSAWVPAHWSLEVGNGMRTAIRRGRPGRNLAEQFRLLRKLRIQLDVESFARAYDTTLQLSLEHNLTVYDAAYLELALRRGLPLATADKQLRAAAERLGIQLQPAA